VAVKSGDKFIPEVYKFASSEARLELLRGLMDTDGSACKNRITFHTTSARLADDVRELSLSLGIVAIRRSYNRDHENKSQEEEVNIRAAKLCPFHSERKKKQWWPRHNDCVPCRYIIKVEKLDTPVEQQCISVAHPSHLYVTDDFIVTHNTAQVIMALDKLGLTRGIIVGPAISRQTWAREIRQWTTVPRKVQIALSLHDLKLWITGKKDVLLCSYEFVTRHIKIFKKLDDIFDFCVIDESHYIKNPTANRTAALLGPNCDGQYGLTQWAQYVWFLTGTPMANDPTDAWTFLRRAGATDLTSAQFKSRWFDGSPTTHGARYSIKPGAEVYLKEMLDSVSIARPKSEWWKDAPPIFMLEMRMHGQDSSVRKLISEHPDLDEAIRQAARDGTLEQLSQEIEYIARLRRLIGEAKAPPFAEELVTRLQGGLDKAVVMCWHTVAGQIVADTLKKHGIESVMIRGDVNPTVRKANIERFQSDPKCRVVIGNIRAAGTNITLTAASDIFMLEQSWSPADNMQALMRVHRIGQTRSVNATFVSLADTIDDVVVATLAEKTANITAIDANAFKLSA